MPIGATYKNRQKNSIFEDFGMRRGRKNAEFFILVENNCAFSNSTESKKNTTKVHSEMFKIIIKS